MTKIYITLSPRHCDCFLLPPHPFSSCFISRILLPDIQQTPLAAVVPGHHHPTIWTHQTQRVGLNSGSFLLCSPTPQKSFIPNVLLSIRTLRRTWISRLWNSTPMDFRCLHDLGAPTKPNCEVIMIKIRSARLWPFSVAHGHWRLYHDIHDQSLCAVSAEIHVPFWSIGFCHRIKTSTRPIRSSCRSFCVCSCDCLCSSSCSCCYFCAGSCSCVGSCACACLCSGTLGCGYCSATMLMSSAALRAVVCIVSTQP